MGPATAGLKPWSSRVYFGLGVFVAGSWIVQNPSFGGYAAVMAYLPPKRIAIAVSSTKGEKSDVDANCSDVLYRAIARYLVPDEAPPTRA